MVWYLMISYDSIAWYYMLLRYWLRRAAVSRKTPIFFIIFQTIKIFKSIDVTGEKESSDRVKKMYHVFYHISGISVILDSCVFYFDQCVVRSLKHKDNNCRPGKPSNGGYRRPTTLAVRAGTLLVSADFKNCSFFAVVVISKFVNRVSGRIDGRIESIPCS